MIALVNKSPSLETSAPPLRFEMAGKESRDGRFTLDGSDDLEEHLAQTCENVLAGIRALVPAKRLEAILLGGGYGRGEGGVLKTASGDQPYNDLEYYVCLRGPVWLNERRYGPAVHELGRRLSSDAGVDVELKIFSLAKLRYRPINMFYYDLVLGHRWVLGDECLLQGCAHHRDERDLPLSEAAHLLMNRCSGLLFAREKLLHRPFTAAEADFVGRNLAKAQLAFGDVVLTATGQYHWSCRERRDRLKRFILPGDLPWLEEVQKQHAAGIHFKLHPERTMAGASTLEARHAQLTALALQTWLWLESHRLHYPFASARDYALSRIDKCPETNAWRNRLINLKVFGPMALTSLKGGVNPRVRLLHALSLLLFEPGVSNEPSLLNRVQRELATTATTFVGLVSAYKSIWTKFN